MFEDLGRVFDRIVVTGPQRSGTTIAAQMIAHDTGYQFVDEHDFGECDAVRFRAQLVSFDIVVQCPAMLKILVDHPPPSVLIVLMRRCLDDIHRSERRVWLPAWVHRRDLAGFGLTEGDAAAIKYEYWDAHRPPNSIEVDYESLSAHWAFVDKSRRAAFEPKQTSIVHAGR